MLKLNLKFQMNLFQYRHFLNTNYLNADEKGQFQKKSHIYPFPPDMSCTALKIAEYLFDVNC